MLVVQRTYQPNSQSDYIETEFLLTGDNHLLFVNGVHQIPGIHYQIKSNNTIYVPGGFMNGDLVRLTVFNQY